MNTSKSGKAIRALTVGAMATALSVVLLYLSSVFPTLRLGMAAIAGLLPSVVVMAGGIGAGFASYAATTILAFLIVPNKGSVLVYGLLLGYYPMVKSLAERTGRRWLEWLIKLGVFNLALTAAVLLAGELLFSFIDIPWVEGVIYLVANIAFIFYDFGFSGLIILFNTRFGKIIRR